MSPQTLAILAAIAVAGYILHRLTLPMRQAAEKKRQARYDADEAVRLAESRQKLEAELAEFPARYQASVEKCRPFEKEKLVASYLKSAADSFTLARNHARRGDVERAHEYVFIAVDCLWDAERHAADCAGAEESSRLLSGETQ